MTHVATAALVDPAWASLINTFLLVGLAFYLKNENTALRAENVRRTQEILRVAAELARTAKGSETRAENAAAEITAMKEKVEDATAQITLIGRSVCDELRYLHGEWDRMHDDRREHDEPTPTPPGTDR